MDAFEYAMALFSIVVGLAIGDMGTSLHKLIRQRRSVRWDTRLVLSAAFTFLMLFIMWFETWSIHDRPEILAFPFLLSLIVELALLFLMATSVLPDDAAEPDLGRYYEDNARPVWTLFLLFRSAYFAHWLYFISSAPGYRWSAFAIDLVSEILTLAGAALLIAVPRRRWLHLVVLTLLLAKFLNDFWGSTIAAV